MRAYMSSRFMSHHEWRVDKSAARTRKIRNACYDALRSSAQTNFSCVDILRRELVNKTEKWFLKFKKSVVMRRPRKKIITSTANISAVSHVGRNVPLCCKEEQNTLVSHYSLFV